MAALAAVFAAFLVALGLRYKKGMHWVPAWLVSCTIVPLFVLFAEFVLPYQGGGASMWPIAIFFGGIYGSIAGGLGVAIGTVMRKREDAKREQVT